MSSLRSLRAGCARCLGLAVLFGLIAACNGSNSNSGGAPADPGSRATVTPAGGTLTSTDGKLTLTFPAGALGSDTEIVITRVTVAELVNQTGYDPSVIEAVYQLAPSGLNFNVPVSLLYRSDSGSRTPGNVAVPILYISSESDDGSVDVQETVELAIDAIANTFTARTDITHFSRAVIERSGAGGVGLNLIHPGELIEQTVSEISLQQLFEEDSSDDRGTEHTVPTIKFSAEQPFMLSGEVRSQAGQTTTIGALTRYTNTEAQDLSCDPATQTASVGASGEVLRREESGARNNPSAYFLLVPDEQSLRSPFSINSQATCITEPDPGGGQLSFSSPEYFLINGLYVATTVAAALEQMQFIYRSSAVGLLSQEQIVSSFLFMGLLQGEAIFILAALNSQDQLSATGASQPKAAGGAQFANLPANRPLAALSGRNGMTIVDLANGNEVFTSLANESDFFGAGIASQGLTASDDAMIVHYGQSTSSGGFPSSGFAEFYFGDDQEFGGFVALRSGTEFDAQPIGGGLISDGVVVSGPTGVSQFLYNGADSSWPENPTGLGIDDLDGGEIVSAYRERSDAPILVITRGSVDNKLYHYEPGTDTATLIQSLRFDARKLRCKPPICVTSSFGSNNFQASGMDVFTWDGVGLPSFVQSIALGSDTSVAGLVGIDLIENISRDGDSLSLLETAVVGVGFNDGQLYEVLLSPSGQLLQQTVSSAPAACLNPGHVTYVPDSQGLKVVGSCFNSSNYFIGSSGLSFNSGADG